MANILNEKIDYGFYDKYYWSDNDASGDYLVTNWKKYAKTWEEFNTKYPFFTLISSVKGGMFLGSGNTFETEVKDYGGVTAAIKSNHITEQFQIISNCFDSASMYTSIILSLWHDDNNVYFKWVAYMKGDVTNFVHIQVSEIRFY